MAPDQVNTIEPSGKFCAVGKFFTVKGTFVFHAIVEAAADAVGAVYETPQASVP